MIHTELGSTKIEVTEKEMKIRGAVAHILNEFEVNKIIAEHNDINAESTCYADLCSIFHAMISKFGEHEATRLTVEAIQECYHHYLSVSKHQKENSPHDL